MNVKSGYVNSATSEARRRRDAALRRLTHMNMSETPFTNIETCSSTSSHEQHETQPAPPRLRDYYANAAYGVIPRNYVRQPIDAV